MAFRASRRCLPSSTLLQAQARCRAARTTPFQGQPSVGAQGHSTRSASSTLSGNGAGTSRKLCSAGGRRCSLIGCQVASCRDLSSVKYRRSYASKPLSERRAQDGSRLTPGWASSSSTTLPSREHPVEPPKDPPRYRTQIPTMDFNLDFASLGIDPATIPLNPFAPLTSPSSNDSADVPLPPTRASSKESPPSGRVFKDWSVFDQPRRPAPRPQTPKPAPGIRIQLPFSASPLKPPSPPPDDIELLFQTLTAAAGTASEPPTIPSRRPPRSSPLPTSALAPSRPTPPTRPPSPEPTEPELAYPDVTISFRTFLLPDHARAATSSTTSSRRRDGRRSSTSADKVAQSSNARSTSSHGAKGSQVSEQFLHALKKGLEEGKVDMFRKRKRNPLKLHLQSALHKILRSDNLKGSVPSLEAPAPKDLQTAAGRRERFPTLFDKSTSSAWQDHEDRLVKRINYEDLLSVDQLQAPESASKLTQVLTRSLPAALHYVVVREYCSFYRHSEPVLTLEDEAVVITVLADADRPTTSSSKATGMLDSVDLQLALAVDHVLLAIISHSFPPLPAGVKSTSTESPLVFPPPLLAPIPSPERAIQPPPKLFVRTKPASPSSPSVNVKVIPAPPETESTEPPSDRGAGGSALSIKEPPKPVVFEPQTKLISFLPAPALPDDLRLFLEPYLSISPPDRPSRTSTLTNLLERRNLFPSVYESRVGGIWADWGDRLVKRVSFERDLLLPCFSLLPDQATEELQKLVPAALFELSRLYEADMPTIHDHTSKNKAFAFHLSTTNTVFPPSPEGSLPDPHRPPKAPRGITSRDMHLAQAVDQVLPVICWYIDRNLRRTFAIDRKSNESAPGSSTDVSSTPALVDGPSASSFFPQLPSATVMPLAINSLADSVQI